MQFEASWGQLIWYLFLLGVVLVVVAMVRADRRAKERAAYEAQQAVLAEDWRRYAAEQSWVDTGQWPLTHYDVYPTDWELTQDLARLKAMGYDIEWQEHVAEGVAVTYSLTPAYKQQRKRRAAPMS
jgi:hypothetical protein